MSEFDDYGLDGLDASLEDTRAMARAFTAELTEMRTSLAATSVEMRALEKGLDKGLRRAFDGLIFGGKSLSDALGSLAQSMIATTYNAAMKPVTAGLANSITGMVGGLFGAQGFAKGGAFSGGHVTPFAKGGVVSQATAFPMRGGTGLMGEAGPEAIMPLSRGPDGSLGVKAQGGGRSVNVTFNISTPDVAGFQRSQTQIAASVNRALAAGDRNA
ncbi:MAG: phage tail tape measure protein [Shimia sp.]